MSYSQFGYTSYASTSPFVVGPGQSSTPQGSSSSSSASYEPRSCGSPEAPPQTSAATVSYDAQRLLSTRLAAVSTGLYGGPGGGYSTPGTAVVDQTVTASPYATLEPAPFYPAALNTAYGMKETADPWRGISQSAPYYYDPTLAAYGYGGLDFNGARRKNVTRDSTSTLKAWLNEHRKNPYPTKGEKIMLAIITKMTLTQVSTWFANARRRLKKENKMTWEPRNKSESSQSDDGNNNSSRKASMDEEQEDDDDLDEGGPRVPDPQDGTAGGNSSRDKRNNVYDVRSPATNTNDLLLRNRNINTMGRDSIQDTRRNDGAFMHHPLQHHHLHDPCRPRAPCLDQVTAPSTNYNIGSDQPIPEGPISSPEMHSGYDRDDVDMSIPGGEQKPKIWSLADTAANKPPMFQGVAGGYQNFPAEWNAPVDSGNVALGSQSYGSGSFHGFSGNYGYGTHGFGAVSLQTDTPPQTPPNMKVSIQQQQQQQQQQQLTLSASSSTTASGVAPLSSSSSSTSSFENPQGALLHNIGSSSVQGCSGAAVNGVHYEEPQMEKKPSDAFATNSLVSFQTVPTGMQCARDDYGAPQVHYRETHQ